MANVPPAGVARQFPYFKISKSLLSVPTWKGDPMYYVIMKTPSQNKLLKRIAEESKDPNLAMLVAAKDDQIALMRPIGEIQDTVKAFLRVAKNVVDPEKTIKLTLRFTNDTEEGALTMGWRERMVDEGDEMLYETIFDDDLVLLDPFPRRMLREGEKVS